MRLRRGGGQRRGFRSANSARNTRAHAVGYEEKRRSPPLEQTPLEWLPELSRREHPNGHLWFCRLGACGHRHRLGGNSPENHGSGLLNGCQALAQEIGVSMPDLDVILGGGSGSPTPWQTTKATASASVSRTCLLVRARPLAPVQHFVRYLMHQR